MSGRKQRWQWQRLKLLFEQLAKNGELEAQINFNLNQHKSDLAVWPLCVPLKLVVPDPAYSAVFCIKFASQMSQVLTP